MGGEDESAWPGDVSKSSRASLDPQFAGAELTRYRMLFNGARSGDVGLVRSLLQDRIDVNRTGPRGATPLHIAARFGQQKMVELLLAYGADRSARDERGSTPADKAMAVGMSSIAKLLSQEAAKPEAPYNQQCRRLLEAAYRGDAARLAQIAAGASEVVELRGPRGASALHVAARYGHAKAVSLLLRLGASAVAKDDSGSTPLDKARQMKHKEVVQLLLEWESKGATATVQPRNTLSDPVLQPHTRDDCAMRVSGSSRPSAGPSDNSGFEEAFATGAETVVADHVSAESKVPEQTGAEQEASAEPDEVFAAEEAATPPMHGLELQDQAVEQSHATPPEHQPSLPPEDAGVVLWTDGAARLLVDSLPPTQPLRDKGALWLVGPGKASGRFAGLLSGQHGAQSALRIGRAPTSELQLPDPEVSGHHAVVWWEADENGAESTFVADRPGSFNGTFLRLSPDREPSTPYAIQRGDTFFVGDHVVTLVSAGGDTNEEVGDADDDLGIAQLSLRVSNLKQPQAPAAALLLPATGRVCIGRARSNELCLHDQSVSANHAELSRLPGCSWQLRDLGSSNGTSLRLSAERIASHPFPLRLGQVLTFGSGPKCSELVLQRFRRGVAERRGKRPSMEDAHVAVDALPAPSEHPGAWERLSFYAVYDGHGGAEASEFCRAHLHKHLLHAVGHALDVRKAYSVERAEGTDPTTMDGNGVGESGDGTARLRLDELVGALSSAFNATDDAFLQNSSYSAGTTAVAALVTTDHVIVANAGDSRAYLLRGGEVLRMSVDHKPERVDEEARIKAAGGWVSNGRVMHTLAVSRAIGDRDFKMRAYADNSSPFRDSLVIPDPEVRVCRAQDGDELLLACDGLWDVMSAEMAFDFLQQNGGSTDPERAVNALVQAADEVFGSADNITAVYVRIASPERA